MLKTILSDFRRLLQQRDVTITFVDIGSRNGVIELRDLAPLVAAYGFEPNPDEYEKLISGKTDLFKISGIKPPKYLELSYEPYAIGGVDGTSEFYVTPGPGACGMLEPNIERLREIIWKGSTFKQNFGDDVFANYRKIQVEVRKLDAFVRDRGLHHIDYLKIDVEGSEYEVFEGGREILSRTGVIKVETCFIPLRKGQKLFSHVDLLLRNHGFDLLRYEIQPAQIGYKQRHTPVEYLPGSFADPYGQPLLCDAIYVNRSITDPDKSLASAAVLAEKKYFDEALHLLVTKAAVDAPALFKTLRTSECYDAAGYRLKAIGYRIVDRLVNTAAIVRQKLGI